MRSCGLLYVILDNQVIEKNNLDIYKLAEELSLQEIDFFQFRFKNLSDKKAVEISFKLSKIFHKRKKIFIINNRPDIALVSDADGVHLGEKDFPVNLARKVLKDKKIVGRTIHSYTEFLQIKDEKIDYLSVGPIFPTSLKPGLAPIFQEDVEKILKETKKPVFAIGGIDLKNLKKVLNMGFKNIALCQGLLLSKNLKKTVKCFKEKLNTFKGKEEICLEKR